MAIEDTNPVFNDRGSQSVPATVPTTRKNTRLLKAPHRIDTAADPTGAHRTAQVVCGAYIRSGVINITEAAQQEGTTFNVGFDNSTAYIKWKAKKLPETATDKAYFWRNYGTATLNEELMRIYSNPDPEADPLAIFPLAINNETVTDGYKKTYWEILNLTGLNGFEQPASVNRVIDGVVTSVRIPDYYCVSPFVRVWRVLELIFEDLDLKILSNPFKSGELAKLVVLNNAADTCCYQTVHYEELLPDCTVEEFLNALWVRFGLVYNINDNAGTVELRLLKDIIRAGARFDVDPLVAGPDKIIYNDRQYIKLSAKTSIEGAAPANERFEDFARGINLDYVAFGPDPTGWNYHDDSGKWDGDINDRETYGDEDLDPYDPDYPDHPDPDLEWDDGRDDDRDDDRDDRDDRDDFGEYSRSGASRAYASVHPQKESYLARESITGTWYHLDSRNNAVRKASTGFFCWDPQPDDISPLELSSVDECVPVAMVSNLYGSGYNFRDYCPLYLCGARHYHSYIIGSDDADKSDTETPLAFMFAYTIEGKTVGRLCGEGLDGLPMTLDDGTTPELSLYFQFKDGLFAKFWADYDEILRHGNRSVELPARIKKHDILKLNMLDVCRYKGIRCLIDSMEYSLPAGRDVAVDMTLRTIQTHGTYDIEKEQNIPNFAVAAKHLAWRLVYEYLAPSYCDTPANCAQAAKVYKINHSSYSPTGTPGDKWLVDHRSAVCVDCRRGENTFENDPNLPTPLRAGERIGRTYLGWADFDIYMVHDMSTDEEPDNWERADTPLGRVTVEAIYDVVLQTVLVPD